MRITCLDSEIGATIGHPMDAARIFLPMMLADRETLVVMCLDERRRVILARRVALGGVDYVTCDMRLVFRPAIVADASYILVAHNHPSGNPTPSQADVDTTKLIEAGATILGINYIDHLVLTTNGRYRSIAEYMETGF